MSPLFELMYRELRGWRHQCCSLQLGRAAGPALTCPKSLLLPGQLSVRGNLFCLSQLPWTGFSGGICYQVPPRSASQWLVLKFSHPQNMSFSFCSATEALQRQIPDPPSGGQCQATFDSLHLCMSVWALPVLGEAKNRGDGAWSLLTLAVSSRNLLWGGGWLSSVAHRKPPVAQR